MSKGFRSSSVCLLGLCLLAMSPVWAQVNTADILGTVSDAGGAVLPNAKITVQNLATNEVKTAATNASGDYVDSDNDFGLAIGAGPAVERTQLCDLGAEHRGCCRRSVEFHLERYAPRRAPPNGQYHC